MTVLLDDPETRGATGSSRLPAPLRAAELALAVLALVAALLVALDTPGVVRSLVVLAALLLVPGWSVLRRFPAIEPAARLVFTVVGSVVVLTVVALAMVWTTLWHPRPAAVVILVAGALLVGVRPVRGPLFSRTRDVQPAAPLRPRPVRTRSPRWLWVSLGLGFALWVVGVATTNSTDLGPFGLLAAFPVVWYLSVAVVFTVVVVSLLTRRRSHGLLSAAIGVLIVVLYASANLVENAPRLPWVYKHIAVTNYITASGSVDPTIDLYNRWPGFFSFSAALGGAIGQRDATTYASWAEVLFALVDAALVLAIARTISRHRRWAWTAVIVFTIGNWVGQNYYSPQAFAFTLYLTAALVAVAALGSEPRRLLRRVENLLAAPARRRGRPVDVEVLGITRSRRARVLAIAAVIVLQAVIVASHQLTPYVAILAFLPLFVAGYLRPLWVGIAVAALPVLYLLPNLDYVEQHFGLFSSFDPVANATTKSVSQVGVSEVSTLQSHGVVVLTGLAVLLALAGFVRRILNGHIRTTLVVAWLAVAPVLTLFGQTYGGEGKFRVFLFGLPFYAMGVGWLFWTGRGLPRIRKVGLIASLCILLSLFVGTYFQPEASLRVSASDVKAAEWLDGRFQRDDLVFSVTDTFPLLVGPNYPNYLVHYAQAMAMTDVKNFDPGKVTNATLLGLIDERAFGGRTWVAFSDSQERAAIVSGAFSAADLKLLEDTVASRSALAYDRDGVRIYEVS